MYIQSGPIPRGKNLFVFEEGDNGNGVIALAYSVKSLTPQDKRNGVKVINQGGQGVSINQEGHSFDISPGNNQAIKHEGYTVVIKANANQTLTFNGNPLPPMP